MATRFIRLTTDVKKAWRRRWGVMTSVAVAIVAAWVGLQTLQAVHHLGVFELDRNVADDAAVGEDWANVYAGTSTAAATSFVTDAVNGSIFTQGGSKDDLDTTNWRHTAGSVPDKDELAHAYAARYGSLLYFGADRMANNGDSQMGFWFFQNDVTPQPNGTFGPDAHDDGDILVLSDFTKGGEAVTIRVFRWNGPGGTIAGSGAIDGTLDLLAGTTANPQDCVSSPIGADNFCATVNAAAFTPPWEFHPKSGTDGQIQKGEFYEGGIDLAFLGLQNECFASFLSETRSSQAVDAVLKDFVGGGFEACTSSVTTTPSDSGKNAVTQITLGQSIYDYAVITGTGSNVAPTGTMTFSICNPTEVASNSGTCATGGTLVGTAVTVTAIANSSPPKGEALSAAYTPNAAGTWCWRGVYSGDTNYPAASDASAGECFSVVQLQPSLTSAQTWTVTDSATVTVGTGAGDLAGSLTLQMWNNGTCEGTPLVNSTVPIAGASPQAGASSTYTINIPGGPATYSWKVTYASTNTGHKNITGACSNENGTLAFTNGVAESTP
jgi:hypothetical protein